MRVIVCLDDRNGMLFNRRRQSQDRCLRDRILSMTEGRVLRMNRYSAGQFDPAAVSRARISENFLDEAGGGDYCFVENVPLAPHAARIEALYVFRWNRVYPSDVRLDLPLDGGPWRLSETVEFPGFSHERITMEVYQR